MRKLPIFLILVLLVLASSAFAQRSFQLRVSVPSPSPGLGFGLEAELQRNLVANFYGDLLFRSPTVVVGGDLLFKPDLGQFDRDLRGISPFIGGGLGLWFFNPVVFSLDITGGIEFELDRSTGIFIAGQGIYFLDGGSSSRVIFGVSFK